MPFEPGRTKTGGRKKGTPNKTTQSLKEAILRAANTAGGAEPDDDEGVYRYLVTLATDSPQLFVPLLGKVLPMTIKGDGDAPVEISFRTVYEAPPKK